jgi:hypothetical protein
MAAHLHLIIGLDRVGGGRLPEQDLVIEATALDVAPCAVNILEDHGVDANVHAKVAEQWSRPLHKYEGGNRGVSRYRTLVGYNRSYHGGLNPPHPNPRHVSGQNLARPLQWAPSKYGAQDGPLDFLRTEPAGFIL